MSHPPTKKKRKIPVILHEKKIKDSEFLVAKKCLIWVCILLVSFYSLSASPSRTPSPFPPLFLKGQFSILLY